MYYIILFRIDYAYIFYRLGIGAGVPQDSDFSPDLYNIYTGDILKFTDILLSTYVDDTAIHATSKNPNLITNLLQDQTNKIDA